MAQDNKNPNPNKPNRDSALRAGFFWISLFMLCVWAMNVFNLGVFSQIDKPRYDQFYALLEKGKAAIAAENGKDVPPIKSIRMMLNFVEGEYSPQYAAEHGKESDGEHQHSNGIVLAVADESAVFAKHVAKEAGCPARALFDKRPWGCGYGSIYKRVVCVGNFEPI